MLEGPSLELEVVRLVSPKSKDAVSFFGVGSRITTTPKPSMTGRTSYPQDRHPPYTAGTQVPSGNVSTCDETDLDLISALAFMQNHDAKIEVWEAIGIRDAGSNFLCKVTGRVSYPQDRHSPYTAPFVIDGTDVVSTGSASALHRWNTSTFGER